MFSALFGTSSIDEQIEKATSENLPSGQEDIVLNLEICDQIRCKQFPAKEVCLSLRKRLRHPNPNVQLLTLMLIDTCIKNGGNHFLVEIASREFMDELVSILKQPNGLNYQVHSKLLELIQLWSESFKSRPELNYTVQIYGALKAQGYKFPPKTNINSVMIDTQTAPEWTDNDVCMRCRAVFTFTNRKHHCRNCGQIYCHACSSNTAPLPHFGITDPVRVCTGCYLKIKKVSVEPNTLSLSEFMASEQPRKSSFRETSSGPPNLKSSLSNPPGGSDDMDEDLKRAIELSLQDAKVKSPPTTTPKRVTFSPPPPSTQEESSEDADLAAAIAASLQDMKIQQRSNPSHNYPTATTQIDHEEYQPRYEPPNTNLTERETQNITLFSTLIEKLNNNPGNVDPTIHKLYSEQAKLVPKLAYNLQDTLQKHHSFLELQAKLTSAVKLYDRLLDQSLQPRGHEQPSNRYHSGGSFTAGMPAGAPPQHDYYSYGLPAEAPSGGNVPYDGMRASYPPSQPQPQQISVMPPQGNNASSASAPSHPQYSYAPPHDPSAYSNPHRDESVAAHSASAPSHPQYSYASPHDSSAYPNPHRDESAAAHSGYYTPPTHRPEAPAPEGYYYPSHYYATAPPSHYPATHPSHPPSQQQQHPTTQTAHNTNVPEAPLIDL